MRGGSERHILVDRDEFLQIWRALKHTFVTIYFVGDWAMAMVVPVGESKGFEHWTRYL